jgi:hypothetical protein
MMVDVGMGGILLSVVQRQLTVLVRVLLKFEVCTLLFMSPPKKKEDLDLYCNSALGGHLL